MSMKKGNSTLHKSRKFGFTLAEVFCPLRKSEAASRIIRDLAGVTSGSTRRAGFASAHTAPYRKFGFTLAEVFCPLRKSKRAAFTLAEVLITLGVIGVVAAITMPSLIQNHQKKEIATRLKQTYSIISQAMVMAQTEHGEMMYWGADDMNGKTAFDAESGEWVDNGSADFADNFADTYFIPYIKNIKDYGTVPSNKVYGVGNGPYQADGKATSPYTRYLALPNGALIRIAVNTSGCATGFDENKNCSVNVTYTGIIFIVDVNGPKKPNREAKDIFVIKLDAPNNKIVMQNYSISERNQIKAYCSSVDDSQVCGALIQMDGWEIADDYPWYN